MPSRPKVNDPILEALRQINRSLASLGRKLDKVIQLQERPGPRLGQKVPDLEGIPLDVNTLLSLPDHLRKTAITIATVGEATATEVAKETSRVRAVESDYLNQLVGMGIVRKKRKGRDVYFFVE